MRISKVILHNIYSVIISRKNLLKAFYEFRKGKRHRAEVAFYELNLEENILFLNQKLATNQYNHKPYIKFKINDPKPRIIHKAEVEDRVVHQAIYRILNHIFDITFIYDSYSSRLKKGTHQAINRLAEFVKKSSSNYKSPCFGAKFDVKKFFDSVDHQILKEQIKQKIKCKKSLKLINKIIDSYWVEQGKGLPLGNVTSQLFANIYLNELDRFIKHTLKINKYIRFCDDFMIIKNNNDFNNDYWRIKEFLSKKLLLELKSSKLIVRKLKWGFDFLGVIVLPYHMVIRGKTKIRIFRKINDTFLNLKEGKITLEKYIQTIQSYLGHIGHVNSYKFKKTIMEEYGAGNIGIN